MPIFNNITGGPATRDTFMSALQSWESTFAFDTYYMVQFDIPRIITDESMKELGEDVVGSSGIDFAKKRLTHNTYQKNVGCIFCTGINLPQESINVQYHPSVQNRGFIGAPYVNSRDTYQPIGMEVYESNISFADFILKPWAIIASHRGAQAGYTYPHKTNMVINELAKGGASYGLFGGGSGLTVRKQTTLIDCFPIRVSSRRITQKTNGEVSYVPVEWAYSRYQHVLPQAAKTTAKKDSPELGGTGFLGRLLGL